MATVHNLFVKGGALCLTLTFLACGSAAPAPAILPAPASALDRPVAAATAAPEPPHALRVEVPALGINLPIVEGDGGSSEPPVGAAAHYPGMAWPGVGNRSFLYAHARAGMFGPLLTSGAVGELVNVDESDGTVLHYAIRSFTRSWPVTDTSILSPTDHEELILYTCTSWAYSDPKVVAIAEPV